MTSQKRWDTKNGSRQGYWEAIVNSEATREGQAADVAEHSTEDQKKEEELIEQVGNRSPRDPSKGKAKPGISQS